MDMEDVLFWELEKVLATEGLETARSGLVVAGQRICSAAQQLFDNERTWGQAL